MTDRPEADALLDELEALARTCEGGLELVAREHDGALERVELRPRGGEPVEVGVDPSIVRLMFCGWLELVELPGDSELAAEARDLALDFVAAAVFGELRVVETRLRGQVLRRRLDVRVDGSWQRHVQTGKLGLAGVRAWLQRGIERRVRSNEGRLTRPTPLREAGPRGVPPAPWAGASVRAHAEPAAIAVDGELDLHNFSPREVGRLVREYLDVCHARGIRDVRIVHGKGKGVLRRSVHALLDGHPLVEDYRLGGHGEGSWGATIVRLHERAE